MCHPGESCIRISDSLMAGFRHADWKSSYSIPSDDTSEGTEPCLRNPFRNALKGSRERTPFRPRADTFPSSATLLSAPGYPLQGFSSLPGKKNPRYGSHAIAGIGVRFLPYRYGSHAIAGIGVRFLPYLLSTYCFIVSSGGRRLVRRLDLRSRG